MIQANSNTSESESVGQSAGQVVHDVVSLAELQIQLFKSDAGEAVGRLVRPLLVFAAGILLLLGTLPVVLIAIAIGLVSLGMPPAGAYALVAVLSIVVAVGMAAWARQRFLAMPAAFTRSQEELVRNITWIKDAVMNLSARQRQSHDDLRSDRFGRS